MQKQVLLLAFIFNVCGVLAQADTAPPFKRYPGIPPLMLTQLNNSQLTKEKLKKNQPTLIFFFSPDCDHCKLQVQAMIDQMETLKKIQIIMATYQPIDQLRDFYHKYKLKKYSNIKLGRDTKYLLPPFYKMKSLPFQALYDRNAKLITTFEGNVGIDVLLKHFQ